MVARSSIASNGNGVGSCNVDHFRIAAALPAQLDTALWLVHIGRGRHEIFTSVSAIHAAVRLQRPPERAVRATQHVRVVVRFDERRPGPAERTVPAVPVEKGVREPFSGIDRGWTFRGQQTDDAPAAHCPTRQSATPDRARTPCEAHWSEWLSDFSRAKR